MTPPPPTPSADSTPPAPSARSAPARVDIDRDSVGRDLVALVLTVVELLRQLMERQAIRRIDAGGLTDDQIERIGTTLMLLDQRMAELCDQHGLTAEDLNLDLGPLGTLLPRD
ncbi:gas vesicle protein K [Streptomyces hygroscopicus]|uniref:gas vesicle protein K n=1 Tax=Streptomyces hygroscopicus TaxID=1912 RepID=UPI000A6EA74C|nr:gas vesicle protein K [Streptomyces hygroscopicus]